MKLQHSIPPFICLKLRIINLCAWTAGDNFISICNTFYIQRNQIIDGSSSFEKRKTPQIKSKSAQSLFIQLSSLGENKNTKQNTKFKCNVNMYSNLLHFEKLTAFSIDYTD